MAGEQRLDPLPPRPSARLPGSTGYGVGDFTLCSPSSPTRWPQDKAGWVEGEEGPTGFFWAGWGSGGGGGGGGDQQRVVDRDLHKTTGLRPEPEHM